MAAPYFDQLTLWLNLVIGNSGNISPTFTITGGSSGSSAVDLPPSTTSRPTDQPGSPPPTTPGYSSSVVHDGPSPSPSPNPTHSIPQSLVPSSSPSPLLNPSPSPSGTQENSSGNTGSDNSAWGNKPTNTIVVSLLAASLVMFFL